MAMNTRQISAFRLAMRLGSMTAAAKALYISQPAVSRLIAELERQLGFPLFRREGGRSIPTPEARAFAEEVERMFHGLDRLEEVGREIRDLRRARLRIATLPMASLEVVPQALKRYLGEHPGLKVTHDVHTSARVIDLVSSRQVDLGIAQSDHLPRHDVSVVASFRCDCVCALPLSHPLSGRAEIAPADLLGVPLIIFAQHTVTAPQVLQRFAEAGVGADVVAESQPSYAACAMAAAGLGAAIVDPLSAALFLPRLTILPFRPPIRFDFHLVRAIDTPLSRPADRFRHHLLQVLAKMPDVRRLGHNHSE